MKELRPIKRLRELANYRQNKRNWDKRWDFPYAGDATVFDREKTPRDEEIVLFDISHNKEKIPPLTNPIVK